MYLLKRINVSFNQSIIQFLTVLSTKAHNNGYKHILKKLEFKTKHDLFRFIPQKVKQAER